MGCPVKDQDDKRIIHIIRRSPDGENLLSDNGVNLSFCRQHAEHFIHEWAGLVIGTDPTDRRIYAVTALSEDQHRALLARGISTAIDAYLA